MQSRTNFYKLSGAVLVSLLLISGAWGQAHAGPLRGTPASSAPQFSAGASGNVAAGPLRSPSGRIYVVQVGDTLFNVAARFNVSVSELATINRVYDVNVLYVGQVLALPNPLPPGAFQNLPVDGPQNPAVNTGTTVSPSTAPIFTPPVVTFPVGTTVTTVTTYSAYVVRPGDFLAAIADRFGTSPQAILSANAISDPNLIFAGQLLTIPHVTTTVVPRFRPVVTPARTGKVYIVQPGDNLFSIAARTGQNAWSIARTNGILDLNAVFVGEPLVIP